MDGPLRLSGAFQLDFRPKGHNGHGVLHHARKPARDLSLVFFRCLGRRFPHNPGHPVPLHEPRIERQPPAFEAHRPQTAGEESQTVRIVIGGVMCDEHELARRQRTRVRAERPILPNEYGIVAAVEPEPVIGPRHDVHDMPPVPVIAPDKLQRREAVIGRVQHPRNDGPQVGTLQIPHEPAMQLLRFRRGLFPFRRSGPERKMRAVQDAVLSGEHGRRHLVVRRKFPQDLRIVSSLAQYGVRVRQRGKPAVKFPEKHARILARGQFRTQVRRTERHKGTVRHEKPIRHEKPPFSRHCGKKTEAMPGKGANYAKIFSVVLVCQF